MAKNGGDDTATLIERIIDSMFDILPANTRDEIATALTKTMKRKITVAMVDVALSTLRKNPFDYEYLVPFVKGGPPREDEENRYVAVLVNRKDKEFEVTPENRQNFLDGQRDNAKGISTSAHCAVTMLREWAKYEKSYNLRQAVQEIAADFEYSTRKLDVVLRAIGKLAA